MRFFGQGNPGEGDVRAGAWIARCVGRAQAVPLGETEVSALATYLSQVELRAGETLFEQGRSVPGVWIVKSGVVELIVGSPRRRLVVQLLRPGDVEGDVSLVVEQPPPYSARAASDATLLFISAEAFHKLLDEHPRIGRRWLTYCTERLAANQARLLQFLSLSLEQKVARMLLDEAVEREITLPQRTLAAMLAVPRPTLNRVLKRIERRDLIAIEYSRIRVLDEDRLARMATT